jgi:hypothetical protein
VWRGLALASILIHKTAHVPRVGQDTVSGVIRNLIMIGHEAKGELAENSIVGAINVESPSKYGRS